jgi:type III secretion system YscJ/HrcJ family lipoprotein
MLILLTKTGYRGGYLSRVCDFGPAFVPCPFVRRLLVLVLLACGCAVELEHGLDEQQANQVLAALEGAGVPADKAPDAEAGTYKISVGHADTARALARLQELELPRPAAPGPERGSSFLPSAAQERAGLAAGLGAGLERTLEALPRVSVARVHVALPPEALVPGEPHARPTASVLLKTRGPQPLDVREIQALVAGAVPELAAADVAVIVTPGPTDGDGQPPLDRLGPLRVARESRATAATLAASGLVVIALLAIALTFTALRLSATRRRQQS